MYNQEVTRGKWTARYEHNRMESIRTLFFILFLIFACVNEARGEQSQIQVGTDLIVDGFGGWSVQFKRSSTFFDNLTIGFGILQINVPEYMFAEYNADNVDKGWEVSVSSAKLFLDYYFTKPNRGFSLGPYISYEKYRTRRNDTTTAFWQEGVGIRFGYTWRPFDNGLYFVPAVAYFISHKNSGSNTVDGESFDADLSGLQGFLSMGYSF